MSPAKKTAATPKATSKTGPAKATGQAKKTRVRVSQAEAAAETEATYDVGTFEASWLPPETPADLPGTWRTETYVARDQRATVRTFYPTPEGIHALGAQLREARQRLLDTTISDLMDLIDRLSARWLDVDSPVRGDTIPGIVATTGFSPEMVAHAIDLEHESSRAQHLERAVQQEIGNPLALDQLTVNPFLMGQTRVVGPEVVGAVFSANIPGLPHLEVMRAFLVKATCLGKVPTGEPVFLGAYARTLAEEAPELAGCLAVIGVDRDDDEARRAFIEVSDYLVAYGGQEAIGTWQAACPPSLRATWHGHRMGFAVVLRERMTSDGLTALGEALAYDFSLFDQEACLAPTTLYVETGGEVSPEALASSIAQGMADQARRFPPRDLSMNERATLRHWLDDRKLDGAILAEAPKGLPWVVLIDPTPALMPTPPGRCVRIVPVDDASTVPGHVRPMRRYLQCAAIAGSGDRRHVLAEALALAGVSRLTQPGLMGLPSMMWRHDGVSCLSAMVRFCDEEVLAPRDNLFED